MEPSDAVFSVGDFSKSLKYGGWPKLMLILDQEQLAHSCRIVRADASPEVIAEASAMRPTRKPSTDGSRICFSRLSGVHACDPYDIEHGRFIRSEEIGALRAILVLTHPHHGGRKGGRQLARS